MPTSDPASFRDRAGIDELLRHSAWLHALARTLVGEADADDVVQETWVAAVARPPRVLGSLRGWLGTVARNVVRKRVRDDARRRERELAASRRDPEPATDQVVARAARMRELVDRVLALDEPYRTTILLRFFEGVKPQEIARRVGASEEAVRQRLKRGLDRLREGLDRDHGGDRESWIAAFAPLVAAPAAPVAAAAGASGGLVVKGILMSTSARIAIAGLVVAAAVGVAVWRPTSRTASDGARAASAEHASAATPAAPTATVTERPVSAPQRDRIVDERDHPASAAMPESGGPVQFVYGAVVDDAGASLDDVQIDLWRLSGADADEPSARSPWSLRSRDGSWSTAGVASGSWHVEARREGCVPYSRDFTIDAPCEGHRVDVVLKRALVIPVRFRTPKGEALADAMATEASSELLCNIAVSGFSSAPPARFEVGFVASGQLDGAGHWFARKGTPYSMALMRESKVVIPPDADGVLVEGDAPAFVAATLKHVTIASARVGDPKRGVDLVVDPAAIRASFATLRLRVVDALTKQPIAGVVISANDRNGRRTDVTTDADGCATCSPVLPGLLMLEARVAGYESLSLPIPVEAGTSVDAGTIELDREVKLRVRVRSADGTDVRGVVSCFNLERWRHGLPADRRRYFGGSLDGRFELSGLGRGRYQLTFLARDSTAMPQIVDTRLDPPPEPELESTAGTEVRFEMRPPEPLQPPTFEIDAADGTLVRSTSSLESIRLIPGSYRLSAWRGETCVVELSFEVGAAPLTVAIPAISDPEGLVRDPGGATVLDAAAPTVAPKILGDPIGIVCYGRVIDGDSRGLSEAEATFVTNRHVVRRSEGRDHCFAVAGLGAGRTERRLCSTKARLPFTDWIDLASGPPLQRRDFHVEPGIMVDIALVDAATGEVVKGVPDWVHSAHEVPCFAVIATKEPPPASVPVADPDGNYFAAYGAGRFQWKDDGRAIHVQKGGTLDVTGPLPVYVSLTSGGRVLHTVSLAAPVAELRLPVDWNAIRELLAGVRFKLVDAESGEPLAATSVEVVSTNKSPHELESSSLPFDADGGYERDGIPAGLHKLFVTAAGHESILHELLLQPGHVTDLGTLALARTRTGSGHLVDESGQPVRAAVLRIDSARALLPVPLARSDLLQSDPDGSFRFAVGRSPFELRVSDDRFAAASIEIDPAHEPFDDVKLVLSRGAPVSIRVAGNDLSRERIVVEDERGRVVASGTVSVGAYRVTLRPGRYVASATLLGEELARDDFEVKGDPVEVVLKR
jgi:RNA polymerase sigma factor (sigma-70 family)